MLGAVTQVINRCGIVTRFVANKQVRADKLRLFAVQDGFQHFGEILQPQPGSVAALR